MIVHRATLSLKRPGLDNSNQSGTQPPPTAQAPVPEPPIERFWFVWATDALRPKKRHASAEAAHAEAQRLRSIAPEREFRVYEAREVSP